MTFTFSKIGGLIVNTNKGHLCIFPANVRFARSKRVLVIFGIGFSCNPN